MTGYVELQASTNFSFLHGASHPEEMFATASLQGHAALGIADRHTVAGIVRAHTAARTTGVRLIPGCRLDLTDGTPLLAYPKDLPAWGRLCRLLGLAGRRGERGDFVLGWEDLSQAPGLILILLNGEPDEQTVARLRRLGGTLDARGDPPGRHDGYLSLSLRQRQGDRRRLRALGELAPRAGLRTVVTGDVLYHEASRSRLQDAVTAIRNRVTLEELGAAREAHRDRHLRSPDEMVRMYRGFEDALARTTEIADRCTFSVAELRYQYPSETEDDDETPQAALMRLVHRALPERYPSGAPEPVARQIAHELDLVASLDYASYFLTVHAIVRQARSMGILCQGRGSAANSVICYILGITAIDPVRSGLLFERFISAERREPPDIDVDFESDRREEIIQWIYRRYGRGHAALCATVMRYQPKGALRDAGKVMGLSEDLLAQMSKHLASALTDDEVLVARAKEIGLDLTEWRLRLTIEFARQLLGVPRQLGTHPGGFVLTRDRLDDLVALQPAAMEDRQIIVWDKDDIDALGFMKVDILGLGMLGCLRRAFELLEKHRGHRLDMATIPAEDPDTYAMIRKADTLGTFQIESRAQMSMLPRLKPTTFYDLVVQVAIVRPGPIQGDMVHPYLRRREGTEPVHFPRPELRRVLGKTLGVPLFQEQAMQVAIQCAGFTPGEADQLRRSMSTFKLSGGVSHFRDKLIEGMVGNGYDRDFAARTFSQLEGFGSYGFPESHAASFALIAYASSYIKCHHPEVFCAALLNAQPMGFYAPAQIVRDAREHRVAVRRIDINRSHWDCTLETGERPGALVVRLGMRLVKGLANADAARLIASRMPLYESIDDVWRRGGVPAAAIERLAEADAFHSLGIERRAALWDIKGLADTPLPLFAAADRGRNRFEPEFLEPLPSLPPMPDGREVIEDYRMTGLSLRRHPLAFLRERLDADGIAACEHIAHTRDGRRISIAGLVLMRQRPGSAKGVMFMTIEDETGIANIVIWKDRIERYRPAVVGSALIVCHGRVQREGDVTHIVADRFEDASPLLRQLCDDERCRSPDVVMPQARDFR